MWEEKSYLGFFVSIFIGVIMAFLFIITAIFPNEFMAFLIQNDTVLCIIGGFFIFIIFVILGFLMFIDNRC
ncbi:hypothetical protein MOB18_20260 [Bacillus inaquosorum]|uniref:hypothetical protein n=1 Tax=Bacillus inaquosorum TaxID=483913 RepID=UPI002281D768|nr:hypothetical protein [Bacillus inaquosorum]MCY7751398.1 hypothetical protein [Bacillus inaquosorum]